MPEGDSLFRLAARLGPLLVARTVLAFEARRVSTAGAASLVGLRIEAVEAKGKNLLVRFEDTRVLHVHLRMHGRVFVERPRSAFWLPQRTTPDLRLSVTGATIVGRHLPVCRLLTAMEERHALAELGPDLTRPDHDPADASSRLRALGDRSIGEALLVQRAAAGIGNVYKSEVLFLEGIDPITPTSALDDATLHRLLARASILLRRNLGDGPRTTRPTLGSARLWVYGRGGKPCLRCGTTVRRFMLGPEGGRSTYVCPTCQPPFDRAPARVTRATP